MFARFFLTQATPQAQMLPDVFKGSSLSASTLQLRSALTKSQARTCAECSAGWAWSVLQVPVLAPLLAAGARTRVALLLSAMGAMAELAVGGYGSRMACQMDMVLARLNVFLLMHFPAGCCLSKSALSGAHASFSSLPAHNLHHGRRKHAQAQGQAVWHHRQAQVFELILMALFRWQASSLG